MDGVNSLSDEEASLALDQQPQQCKKSFFPHKEGQNNFNFSLKEHG